MSWYWKRYTWGRCDYTGPTTGLAQCGKILHMSVAILSSSCVPAIGRSWRSTWVSCRMIPCLFATYQFLHTGCWFQWFYWFTWFWLILVHGSAVSLVLLVQVVLSGEWHDPEENNLFTMYPQCACMSDCDCLWQRKWLLYYHPFMLTSPCSSTNINPTANPCEWHSESWPTHDHTSECRK